MTDAIRSAIAASKARDGFQPHCGYEKALHAREWELRFRDALEVAAQALSDIYCRHGKLPNGTHSTFSRADMARHAGDAEDRIAAILEGRAGGGGT